MREDGVRVGKVWRVQVAGLRKGFVGRGGRVIVAVVVVVLVVVEGGFRADGGTVASLLCRAVETVGVEARVVASEEWLVGRGASVAMPCVKVHRWAGWIDGRKPVNSCFAGMRAFCDAMM